MKRRTTATASMILALLVSTVQASPPSDATPEVEAARGHFRSGSAWYAEGRYDKAIAEFEAAWELAPLPDILFNLGQAHRLGGDKRAAIRDYRRFLGTSPRGPAAVAARRYLEELEAEVAREDREREERLAAQARQEAEEQRQREERQRAAMAAEAAARAASVPAPALAPGAPPETPLYRRWWPWAVAGGAVLAGVAVGLGVGLGAAKDAPEASTDLGTFRPF